MSVDRIVAHLRGELPSWESSASQRLPSVRLLARREGVGPATVQAAYQQLAAEGLVEARLRIGWFAVSRKTRQRRDAALETLRQKVKPSIEQTLMSGLSRTLVRREVLRIIQEATPRPLLLPQRLTSAERSPTEM